MWSYDCFAMADWNLYLDRVIFLKVRHFAELLKRLVVNVDYEMSAD